MGARIDGDYMTAEFGSPKAATTSAGVRSAAAVHWRAPPRSREYSWRGGSRSADHALGTLTKHRCGRAGQNRRHYPRDLLSQLARLLGCADGGTGPLPPVSWYSIVPADSSIWFHRHPFRLRSGPGVTGRSCGPVWTSTASDGTARSSHRGIHQLARPQNFHDGRDEDHADQGGVEQDGHGHAQPEDPEDPQVAEDEGAEDADHDGGGGGDDPPGGGEAVGHGGGIALVPSRHASLIRESRKTW